MKEPEYMLRFEDPIKKFDGRVVLGPSVPHFNGHPAFYEILNELRDLHSRKNADYANQDPLSNLKMCAAAGIPPWKGVIVRLTDKISRLMTFSKRESYEVTEESVEDTFRDAAIYAILGLILYREGKKSGNDQD